MVYKLSSALLLVLLLCVLAIDGARHPKKSKENLLERVWSAVERGTKFFADDYSSVNLDGLYGLRVGQGQILEAIKEQREHGNPRKKGHVLKRLLAIEETLSRTGDGAMPYVEAEDPAYFRRFREVIAAPYRTKYVPRHFTNLSQVTVGQDTDYREEPGDACLSRLLGSFEENGRIVPKCNITDFCFDLMTKSNTSEYFITHQLLYLILMEHLSCTDTLAQFQDSFDMSDLHSDKCAAIFKEAQQEVKDGDVTPTNRDLFMEQTLLCGMLGFEDFASPEWIRMVLGWQAPEGCFKIDSYSAEMRSRVQNAFRKQLAEVLAHPGRALLRESPMKDGCLSHMTGLGFGSVCLYLRVLLHHSLV